MCLGMVFVSVLCLKLYDNKAALSNVAAFSDQSITLNEFFNSTEGKFRTKTGQAWAVEIYKRRAAAARAGNESPSGSTKAQARFQGNVPESIPDQKKQRTD